MTTADQFRNVIIASPNGKPIRLGDVARVIDSVANTQTTSSYDKQPGAGAGSLPAAGREHRRRGQSRQGRCCRNSPTISDRPASINVFVDRSTSIVQAVHDVEITLAITIGLVALVIFLFLRRLSGDDHSGSRRADLADRHARRDVHARLLDRQHLAARPDSLPSVSLSTTRSSCWRTSSATSRRACGRSKPRSRAVARSDSPSCRSRISLVAVFLPVLLMGGVVGRIFNEFAMVVTISIIASTLVSLTLTPMLCGRLPADERARPRADERSVPRPPARRPTGSRSTSA